MLSSLFKAWLSIPIVVLVAVTVACSSPLTTELLPEATGALTSQTRTNPTATTSPVPKIISGDIFPISIALEFNTHPSEIVWEDLGITFYVEGNGYFVVLSPLPGYREKPYFPPDVISNSW